MVYKKGNDSTSMGKIIVQKKDYVIIIDNVYRSGTFASGTRTRNATALHQPMQQKLDR